jgi:CRP-like cAMP-binding protein
LTIKRAKRFIKDFESQWAESTTNGDTSVFNRILANDFIGSEGNRYNKNDAIAETLTLLFQIPKLLNKLFRAVSR